MCTTLCIETRTEILTGCIFGTLCPPCAASGEASVQANLRLLLLLDMQMRWLRAMLVFGGRVAAQVYESKYALCLRASSADRFCLRSCSRNPCRPDL